LPAKLTKTTQRPSAEIEGAKLFESPCAPALETLTHTVVPSCTSRTKTSPKPFVSPRTRFVAALAKAT
jgi:hypothetical protein